MGLGLGCSKPEPLVTKCQEALALRAMRRNAQPVPPQRLTQRLLTPHALGIPRGACLTPVQPWEEHRQHTPCHQLYSLDSLKDLQGQPSWEVGYHLSLPIWEEDMEMSMNSAGVLKISTIYRLEKMQARSIQGFLLWY